MPPTLPKPPLAPPLWLRSLTPPTPPRRNPQRRGHGALVSRVDVVLILTLSAVAAYIGAATYPEPAPIYAPGGGL